MNCERVLIAALNIFQCSHHMTSTWFYIKNRGTIRLESGLVTDNTTRSVKGTTTAQFHNAHRTHSTPDWLFCTLWLCSLHYLIDWSWLGDGWLFDWRKLGAILREHYCSFFSRFLTSYIYLQEGTYHTQ